MDEATEREPRAPGINWCRNWASGLAVDQTIRVPSLMISGSEDLVLRPGMAAGMHAHVPESRAAGDRELLALDPRGEVSGTQPAGHRVADAALPRLSKSS